MNLKNILKISVVCAFILALISTSLPVKADLKEAKLETSVCCKECKTELEKGLKTFSGISSAKVNLKSKFAMVKYDPSVTSEDKIKQKIVDLGYAPGAKDKCKDKSGKGCCDKKAKSTKAEEKAPADIK